MRQRLISLAAFGLLLAALMMAPTWGASQAAAEDEPQSYPGRQVILRHDPRDNPYRVAPPPLLDQTAAPQRAEALVITVVFNPAASCQAVHPNDPNPAMPTWVLTAWPAQAQAMMNRAGLIWSTLLNGSRPVVVHACWYSTLGADVLGQAGPNRWYRGFKNAPETDTSYPVALANQYNFPNADLNGADPEINASFSGAFTWYFGSDANVPAGKTDFLSVALHEIGHGLGFLGGANWDDGMGADECEGTAGTGCISDPPTAYDRFVFSGNTAILEFTSPSAELGNALIFNNLFFSSPGANAANGNAPARLFAPNAWDSGSSYVHLDEVTFDNTVNALMTPQLAQRESLHHPGPIALGMFADMGWPVNSRNQVYVKAGHTGPETGTIVDPYNTVSEGAAAVNPGGTVLIGPGIYDEQLTISRAMTLRTTGGTVGIGR